MDLGLSVCDAKLMIFLYFWFSGILETVWDKHSVSVTTPPPSPTSRETGELCVGLSSSGFRFYYI